MIKKHKGHPRFYDIIKEMEALHDRKNEEYTKGSKQGPLGNFTRTSTLMKMYPGMDWDSPLGVALCYMLKQLDSVLVMRSTKRDSVVGEPLQSRLRDIAVYTIIAEILESEERAAYRKSVASFIPSPSDPLAQYSGIRPMPKAPGKTVRFKRYANLKLPITPLTEGRKPYVPELPIRYIRPKRVSTRRRNRAS